MALLRHDTSQAVELTGMPLQVVLRLLDALESPEDGPLVLREVNVEFLRRLLFDSGVLVSDAKLDKIFETMQRKQRTKDSLSVEMLKRFITNWRPMTMREMDTVRVGAVRSSIEHMHA